MSFSFWLDLRSNKTIFMFWIYNIDDNDFFIQDKSQNLE